MSFTNIPILQAGGSPAPLNKFNREYVLEISGTAIPDPIVIKLPFTIEFDIERNNYSSVNRGTLKIYNLSRIHRQQIVHDQWDQSNSGPQTIYVVLQAGYGLGPNYPVILKGNATRAFSYRQGVNFITQIDVFDGGLAYINAVTSRTFQAGTQISFVAEKLIKDLTNHAPFGLSVGVISDLVGQLGKSTTYSGNPIQLLVELSNSNFFIDNLKANILLQEDAVGGSNVVVNSQSGLLGTPIKEAQWLLVNLLFEPRLTVGSVINLDSIGVSGSQSHGAYYNGPHKVVSVAHRGMISSAVCGEVVTSLGLLAGEYNLIFAGPNGQFTTVSSIP